MGAQGRRRAERPERTRTPLALVAVAVAAILVTVTAIALWPAPEDGRTGRAARTTPDLATPMPLTTPSVELGNLPIRRSLDCRVVDDDAVRVAIGGPVGRRESYVNGDRVEITPGVTDIAHEDSCSFANADSEARIWVFAAPVTPAEAGQLVRQARGTSGCRFLETATGFGDPDLTGVCVQRPPGTGDLRRIVATLRGRFGDAWLSCELSDSGDTNQEDVLSRASRWCVHVATTLGARP